MSGTSPQDTSDKSVDPVGRPAPPPQFPNPGMVGHVRVLCILMWVQGGLEMVMGGMTCVGAIFCGSMIWAITAAGPQQGAPQPDQLWFLATVYGLAAAVPLLTGLVRIYAALRNFQFQRRGMGIFAISLGMLSIVSFYLAPTAIALFVYGLIVYFNRETRTAFEMGERGCSYDEIHWTFWPQAQRWPMPPPPYPGPYPHTNEPMTYAVFGAPQADTDASVVAAEVWEEDPVTNPPGLGVREGQGPRDDSSSDVGSTDDDVTESKES